LAADDLAFFADVRFPSNRIASEISCACCLLFMVTTVSYPLGYVKCKADALPVKKAFFLKNNKK
jgi:hypothetical protein